MLSEAQKKEILSETLYEEFDSTRMLTAVEYVDTIRHHLGSSAGPSEMRDNLQQLHHLIMESQNSERHTIEDISDVSTSIESGLVFLMEAAEDLQRIMGDLSKVLDVAWTQMEEGEEEND